ncbi:MAG: D-amino acid dehydrogenase [Gammaproteobacteria bacterium]|nr:D-amino acid dehydrogenase [Gammaproteobacteria bacterium]
MKIIIAGSGVIGVTTAYYLSLSGHDVTVIDRQHTSAMETSHANAGMLSTGYSAPWAAPNIPLKAIKWLSSEFSPLIISKPFDLSLISWAGKMLMNCTSERYEANKNRLLELAQYSQKMFADLQSETSIKFDHGSKGTLQLFRKTDDLKGIETDIKILADKGITANKLSIDDCIVVEPGLEHVRSKIAGGLHIPVDETGDCFKFTSDLEEKAKAAGVKFEYGVDIDNFEHANNKITGIVTSNGKYIADKYVMALGSYSPLFLKPLGINVPIYPVKGYSLTIPVKDESSAPVSTIMDETYKVAITRLGDRIRVGGTAELGGYNTDLPLNRRKTVDHVIADLFPKACDISEADFWSGLRPMTPDGAPIIGESSYENLYLNTGHGTLGWTLSCGSAKLLSDIVLEKETEIDASSLGLERYGQLKTKRYKRVDGRELLNYS